MKRIILAAAFLLLTSSIFACEKHAHNNSEKKGTMTQENQKNLGKKGDITKESGAQSTTKNAKNCRLEFHQKPNKSMILKARLCCNKLKKLEKISFSMPDMNHGTAKALHKPQTKKDMDMGCVEIENIQLFMDGKWHAKIQHITKDGSKKSEVLEIEVK